MDNPEKLANKRQRILKGQSKMDNPEKLANKRQDEVKQNKNTVQYVLDSTNKHKHCKQDIC